MIDETQGTIKPRASRTPSVGKRAHLPPPQAAFGMPQLKREDFPGEGGVAEPSPLVESSGPQNILAVAANRILKTQRAVPTLAKTSNNPQNNYNYASIDDYYSIVAKLAAENGLSWWVTVADNGYSFPQVINDGVGKPKTLQHTTYEFTLIVEDVGVIQGFRRVNITGPYVGCQTAGIFESYAEKQFMRNLFKVVTGEVDADAMTMDGHITKGDPKASTAVAIGRRPATEDDPFGDM